MRWMMEGIREECKKQRLGGKKGESREIRMVILAGLKTELLKFGLILPNLCFCPGVVCDECVCVALKYGNKEKHQRLPPSTL